MRLAPAIPADASEPVRLRAVMFGTMHGAPADDGRALYRSLGVETESIMRLRL